MPRRPPEHGRNRRVLKTSRAFAALPSLRRPPLTQSFGNHGGRERVQADALLPRLDNQARVKAPWDALPPLPAGLARLWNRVAVFGATQEVGLDCVTAVLESGLRSAPVGNAARQIGIFDGKAAAIRFRERADRKRLGVDEGLVNLHFSHPLCRPNPQTDARTPA